MKPSQALSMAATHAAEMGNDLSQYAAATSPIEPIHSWIKSNPWYAAGIALLLGSVLGMCLRRHR